MASISAVHAAKSWTRTAAHRGSQSGDGGCGLFRASVPSGASIRTYEAVELRDGGDRYLGGVSLSGNTMSIIILGPIVLGMDPVGMSD
jgi:hypothetical protein